MDRCRIEAAAKVVAAADALLVGAGAGMGVDSGLPDFRGDTGFWQAYPPFAKLGLRFVDLANPRWFTKDPTLAWGFYGHRLNLYRATQPHAGFAILHAWGQRKRHGAFVYTSNVDGHFQKAGFATERVMEVHGSLNWLQCTRRCGVGIFPIPDGPSFVQVEETTMRAAEPLPACPACGALARPNVLMFSDWGWEHDRSWEQEVRMGEWLEAVKGKRVAIVECGAGTAVPSVRNLCEQQASRLVADLVRINVREPEVPQGQIGIAAGAWAALQAIDQALSEKPR